MAATGVGPSGLRGWPSLFSRGVGIQAPTALVAPLSRGPVLGAPTWPRGPQIQIPVVSAISCLGVCALLNVPESGPGLEAAMVVG